MTLDDNKINNLIPVLFEI